MFGFASFTVALRFKSRKLRGLRWEIDDYAVLVALVRQGRRYQAGLREKLTSNAALHSCNEHLCLLM